MHVKSNVTYWGMAGKREVKRKVNSIETRYLGTQYVNWTLIKKDGSSGMSGLMERGKFEEWAKGIYEIHE
ncbi:hypothetical protein WMW72_10770 [Paenibacillus filicis]|uniref:Uncharacterized protein n=1 Tax=Paenibacillus filicis TaxID=669464 RepID=A0ABU9DJG5_9BACL